MSDETETKPSGRRRSTRTSGSDSQPEPQNATEPTAEDEAQAIAAEGTGVEPGTGAPEPSEEDREAAENAEQAQNDQSFNVGTLTKRADDLLGVSPALASAVLKEHDEETITIEQAKQKVQEFLGAPVVANEEA